MANNNTVAVVKSIRDTAVIGRVLIQITGDVFSVCVAVQSTRRVAVI